MTDDTTQLVADLRRALPPIETTADWLNTLRDRVCIDCEWDDDRKLTLVGVGNFSLIVQLCWQQFSEAEQAQAAHELLRLMREVPVVYHNADADLRTFRANGVPVAVEMHKQLDDTMLADGVLNCELDHDLGALNDRCGKLPPYKHLQDVAPDVYNAADVLTPLWIWTALEDEFAKDPAAERVYRKRKLAKLKYIIEDEERGIAVNQPHVYPLRDELVQKRTQATLLGQAYCGFPIKLSSPNDLKFWAYDIEGFPVQRAKAAPGEQGNPTLDKDALAVLRRSLGTEFDPDESPTLEQAWTNIDAGGNPLLEARYLFFGAQQSLSHYVDPCFVWDGEQILSVRDRLYPETRQHVQASGRDSYVGTDWPGRAGIPVQQLRGKMEYLLRPDPGYVWIGHDWSNIETWILGVLAGDPMLLKAKAEGWDTHTINVCDVLNYPLPPLLTKAVHTAPECEAWRQAVKWQGDEDLRRLFIKRWVYRIHYRGQAKYATDIPGARTLGIDAERSVACAERYLGLHHWIPEYWARIDYDIEKYGVIYAPGGMPRRLTSPYPNARKREGGNHQMQGGVAWVYDEVRLAVHRTIELLKFDAWFVFGKHDSHWWSVRREQADEFEAFYRPLVQREFVINGRRVSFPASFKRRDE